MRRFIGILLIIVLGLSVVASGCIGGGNEGSSAGSSGKGITLTIVTRHDATIQYKVKQLFLQSDIAKQYNIEDIKFIGVPESLWPSYIEKGADVGWGGGGPTLFDNMYRMGYLAPITDQKILDLIGNQIPEELAGMPMVRKNGSQVYWIAAALSSFGFTVNKEVLNKQGLPFPNKWEDIASPDWARDPQMYGIADPTRSTSNTRIYQIILQAFGWDEDGG